jgi:hypothetical protein
MPSKKWLTDLKLAIINNNIEKIVKCCENIPTFDNLQDTQTAMALLKQSEIIIKQERNNLSSKMQKIKQIKNFLK